MVAVTERGSLLLKGTLDLCILAVIGEQSLYGYEVQTRLGERGLPVAEGTVYPLLARLLRAGLIEVHSRPSPTGPPRRYYTLTAAGADLLAGGTQHWREFSAVIDSVLTDADADADADTTRSDEDGAAR